MNLAALNMAALSAISNGDLKNAIIASTPGGIEAQEKQGQSDFVNSEVLPKEMTHGCTREKLEKIGIKFGKDADDLFVFAQLPDGWTKKPTDHSMWSNLFDNKGRNRASIFFKAAFYDRNAHISLNRRYNIKLYEPCNFDGNAMVYEEATHRKTVITDCDTVIHTVAIRDKSDYKIQEKHYEQAKQWLTDHYPNWEDDMAYWN